MTKPQVARETLRPDPLTHALQRVAIEAERYHEAASGGHLPWDRHVALGDALAALRATTPDPAEPFDPKATHDDPLDETWHPDRPAEPGLPWLRARVRDAVHRQYDANDIDRWAVLKAIDAALDTARTEGLDVDALTERLHNDPALCKRYSPRGHPDWWLNPPCRQIAARLAHPEDPALEHRS